MLARLGQVGPMFNNPMLPTLEQKLSKRWSCSGKMIISIMAPWMDFMMVTIPDTEGPRSEILTAALIRLSTGNATYIIRHFSPPSRLRDLLVSTGSSTGGPDSIYKQLRSHLLGFERQGVHIGWRVMGVRKAIGLGNF